MLVFNTCLLAVLGFLFSFANATKRDCVPGTFFNGRTCNPCPSGTYQRESGQSNCVPCPPGSYYPFNRGAGLDVCLSCPKNTFNDKEGATSLLDCKPCPSGKVSAPFSSHCISCPAGTAVRVCRLNFDVTYGLCFGCEGASCYTYKPFPFCDACPKHFFSSKPNSHFCTACPMNSRTPVGSAKCNICPRTGCIGCNEFEVYDPTTVIDEEFGHDDYFRSSGCRPCQAGFVGNRRRNAVRCVRCAPGTFKNEGISGPCVRCDSDPADVRSGSYCAACNKQQRFNPELQICEACPDGQISEGGKATRCKRCPRGSTGTLEGCKCLPGWEPAGRGRCRICPPGYQGPTSYRRTCSRCFRDHAASKAGTPGGECRYCPSGTEANRQRTRCVPISKSCPEGFFVSLKKCYSYRTNCPRGQTRTNRVIDFGIEDFTCS